MKKALLILTCVCALGMLSTPAFCGEKVNIGKPSWIGAQAIAALLQAVVIERIGGEADLIPGSNATIFQAMDQGKGDIDVHPDVWLPNQEAFTKKYVDGEKTVTLSKNPYQGNQGYCVAKWFAEAYNITDITDLGRPDVAAKMDSDGNGKGEMWIGAPGWASANVNEVKVRDYNLLPFIDPIRAEESVKTARVKDSIQKEEGYAFYCYKPHAIWFMFDVVMLTEPKYDPAKYIMFQPSKEVQIAWSNSLKKRSPAITEFLERFGLTADDVSNLAYQVSSGRDAYEVASEWIKKNPKRVDAWLGL